MLFFAMKLMHIVNKRIAFQGELDDKTDEGCIDKWRYIRQRKLSNPRRNEDDVPFDVREIVGSLFIYGLADVNNGKQDIKYISLLYV